MKILALDSSGSACSAALWAEGRLWAHRFERLERGHAERLVPMVLEVMAEAAARFAEIDLFAATTGPGAFTGLRIGLATLRALALAAGRPMFGITSFEAIAHETAADARKGRTLLVLIESKRADLYAQAFTPDLRPASAPVAALSDVLAKGLAGQALLLAGDGAPRAQAVFRAIGCDLCLAPGSGLPDAAVVAALAATRSAEASLTPPVPLYLRPADATLPKGGSTR